MNKKEIYLNLAMISMYVGISCFSYLLYKFLPGNIEKINSTSMPTLLAIGYIGLVAFTSEMIFLNRYQELKNKR
jgi:hypothetical protein